MNSNNNGQVHTNFVSTSTSVGGTITTGIKKTGSFFKTIKPYAEGVLWGALISFIIVGFLLSIALSAAEGRCDSLGDKVGYASQYSRSQGCEFKIDGKWTPVDSLTLEVKGAK